MTRDKVRELAEEIATVPRGDWNRTTRIEVIESRLRAFLAEQEEQLHRALGEGAGLRRVIDDAFERGDLRMNDFEEDPLTASPLSKLAGEVLATVGKLRDCGSPEVDEDLHDLLYEQDPEIYTKIVAVLRSWDALRAELAREGGEGG